MDRPSASATIAVISLVLATGYETAAFAAAKVKSHSNQSNNRTFNAECTTAGGKVSATVGQSDCTLPSMAVKGSGVPEHLSAACLKDGGKLGIAVDHAGGNGVRLASTTVDQRAGAGNNPLYECK